MALLASRKIVQLISGASVWFIFYDRGIRRVLNEDTQEMEAQRILIPISMEVRNPKTYRRDSADRTPLSGRGNIIANRSGRILNFDTSDRQNLSVNFSVSEQEEEGIGSLSMVWNRILHGPQSMTLENEAANIAFSNAGGAVLSADLGSTPLDNNLIVVNATRRSFSSGTHFLTIDHSMLDVGDADTDPTSGCHTYQWYKIADNEADGNFTITETGTDTEEESALHVTEWSGNAVDGTLVTSNTSLGLSSNVAHTSGSVTVPEGKHLIIAGFGFFPGSSNPNTPSFSDSFINESFQDIDNGSDMGLGVGVRQVEVSGMYTTTLTITQASTWAGVVGVYKEPDVVSLKSGGRSSGPKSQVFKRLTVREQTLLYHGRQRRLSHINISKGLSRTLFLGLTPASHSDLLWPTAVRNRLYTIEAEIVIDAASAEGVIFEIGDTSHGAGIIMDSGILYVFAGGNGTDGVDINFTPTVGRRLWVALAMSPGNGIIGMYIDGKLQVKGQSADTTFPSGQWAASSEDAGIGQVDVSHNDRVPTVNTLTNISIVSPVSFFAGQVPRGLLI